MNPRRWRPAAELEAALDRGDLRFAVTLAEELRAEGKHVPLELACRFLPLIARESRGEYDAWALRWLARWASEAPTATAERAAEVAATLAELPAEPALLEQLRRDLSGDLRG